MDPEHRGRCSPRKHGPDGGHRPALPAQEGSSGAGRLDSSPVDTERDPRFRGGRGGEAGGGEAEGGPHPRRRAAFCGRGLPVRDRHGCQGARGQYDERYSTRNTQIPSSEIPPNWFPSILTQRFTYANKRLAPNGGRFAPVISY